MERKYSQDELDRLKSISIVDYLHSLGYKETHTANQKKDYFFDLTNSGKQTGETHVSVPKNSFYDFGVERGGDIIQLVRKLHNLSFVDAVKHIQEDKKISSFSILDQPYQTTTHNNQQDNSYKNSADIITLTNAAKIANLKSYAKERHISEEILYLSKVEYLLQDKYYFLGLKNDSNGYSVRNKAIKGVRGVPNISTITYDPGSPYIVVEGMFEYLSILEMTKQNDLNFIILNSTTFADQAADKINSIDNPILLILNGDNAGKKATQKIIDSCPSKNIKTIELTQASDINASYGNGWSILANQIIAFLQSIPEKKNSITI